MATHSSRSEGHGAARAQHAQHAQHGEHAGGGHGHTAAAWTAVTVMLVGSVISTLGVILLNWVLFWVGMVVIAIGAVLGKVMAMMGFGATVTYTQPVAAERAEGKESPDAYA